MEGQSIGLQVILAVIVPWVLEWLKRSSWFPYLTRESDKIVRGLSALAAAFASVGVTIQSDWTVGHYSIDGLTPWVPLELALRFGGQLLAQELNYRKFIKKE